MPRQYRIVMAIGIFVAWVVLTVIVVGRAIAQTPTPRPDVPLLQSSGIYPMSCVPTAPMDDVVKACFVRTDVTPMVELGCVPANSTTTGHIDLTLDVSIDEVAQIRCYTVTSYGVVSDYSENAGTVDFTRPGKPYVSATP